MTASLRQARREIRWNSDRAQLEFQNREGRWVPVAATRIVDVGYPPPPRPTFTSKVICWMEIGSTGLSTNSLSNNTVYYTLHYEEIRAATYDAMLFSNSTGVAGALCKLALYDTGSNGNPTNLLWTGAEVDISAATDTASTFAAGTWDASGASYKDASNRLSLHRGQSVWLAIHKNGTGAPDFRIIGAGNARALGRPAPASGATTPYRGFSQSQTYANGLPDPTGSLASLDTQSVPCLALRWV